MFESPESEPLSRASNVKLGMMKGGGGTADDLLLDETEEPEVVEGEPAGSS